MVKRTVGHGHMTCLVFIIGSVHADINGFSTVHKSQIFNMDVAAVDAQRHPVFEQ